MSHKPAFVFLALTLFASFAYAGDHSVSEETSVGSSHFIQNVNFGGDFGANGASSAPFDWGVTYTYEKSSTPNPGGSDIVDSTSDFTGDFGWTSESGWGVSGFADVSNTPAENLKTTGGGITGSYKWSYGSGELDFHPYLISKINVASTTYKLSTDATTSFRKVQNHGVRTGEIDMKQTMIGPEFVWRPWEQWKFLAGANFYHYDRDVNQFENNLDSAAALRLGVSGFSDTVGGLPRISYILGVFWFFHPDWALNAKQDISVAASDGGTSGTSKLTLDYTINSDWRAHLGAEIFTSTIVSDTLVIAGLEYNF
jgi:hypothetical protein